MKEGASDELRVRILDEAAKLFDQKGMSFTMDDLAHSLGMSKKTIYTVFRNKHSIMTGTLDRFFAEAYREQEEILNDESLSVADQLRKVLGRVPEHYAGHDLSQLYILKRRYPSVYRHWFNCREEYWNSTEALIAKGVEQGVIRPVSLPIIKSMFQHTVEQFFQSDILIKNRIEYKDALSEIADILVDGISVK